MTSIDELRAVLACPVCGGGLTEGRCSSCGERWDSKEGKAYFIAPPADYEQDGMGPNVARESWGSWRSHNFDYFKEKLLSTPSSAVVLDLGAGPGQFHELTERFTILVSMDFRPFPRVNVVADLTKRLPLKDASIDVVMASNVLEHIPDTAALLAEIKRVLKPGGIVIATIPFLMRVHQKPYDFNRYTNFQLTRLLAAAGFSAVEVKSLSSPADVYAAMERHFFATVLENTEGIQKLLLRALRFTGRVRHAVLSNLASRTPSPDYTEGYGCFARNS